MGNKRRTCKQPNTPELETSSGVAEPTKSADDASKFKRLRDYAKKREMHPPETIEVSFEVLATV